MSIPKEPRQLMINLMYLVLTALLALNVSAEVMNAFFSLDKGMKDSRSIVEKNNDSMTAAIDKGASDYPSPQAAEYNARAKKTQQITTDFVKFIDEIRDQLFEKAGGPNPKVPGQPKDIRNKDITTKMFVNDKLGDEIMARIQQTRDELIKIADNDATAVSGIALAVEPLPEGVKAKSWPEYKFKQMPVSAVFPLLGKIQSDAKSSASAVLNYCATKVTGTDFKVDKFLPGVNPKKNYLILGETFEAEVYPSAYSSKSDGISVNVDGQNIPLKDGIGTYSTKPGSIGEKKYTVTINVKNPATGQTESVRKEFSYEVGQRSVAVSLDKMNVFYIGVENPISVSAAGVSSNDVRVTGSGGGINVSSKGGGKYVVTVSTPGEANLTVSGGGATSTFTYRVKRIPDPTPLLGAKHRSKAMGNGEFKAQSGIAAILENFDFEARCEVVGFEATYLKKRQDPSPEIANNGARFNERVQGMVNQAGPGDQYFFDNVKARCPGDAQPRNLGGLAFKIR